MDSPFGGTGTRLALEPIRSALGADPGLRVVLAGGLDPDNVGGILSNLAEYSAQIVAVDVSSGVESDGTQDLDKIRDFVRAAKTVVDR